MSQTQQYSNQLLQQQQQQTQQGLGLTWQGLLGGLGLAAAVLLGIAASLFMLYVRPILQVSYSMNHSVTYSRNSGQRTEHTAGTAD
jgi:hypothetical protein